MNRWRLLAGCLMLGVPTAAAAACNVNPQGMSFGNYDPLAWSALDGAGNVHVDCDSPTSFTVSFGPGNGSIQDRRMSGSRGQLAYNLFKDSSRLMIWGDGATGVSSTGTGVDLTVYGRIPGMQNVQADVYADSVSVTVTF